MKRQRIAGRFIKETPHGAHEKPIIDFMEDHNIPVAHCFAAWEQGMMLADLGDVRLCDEPTEENYAKVCDVIADYEGLAPTFLAPMSENYFMHQHRMFEHEFLHRYMELPRTTASGFHATPEAEGLRAACRQSEMVVCHADLHSRNIMIRDGEVVIVDWKGASMGPDGWDLACLYVDPWATAKIPFELLVPHHLCKQRLIGLVGSLAWLVLKGEAEYLAPLTRCRDLLATWMEDSIYRTATRTGLALTSGLSKWPEPRIQRSSST